MIEWYNDPPYRVGNKKIFRGISQFSNVHTGEKSGWPIILSTSHSFLKSSMHNMRTSDFGPTRKWYSMPNFWLSGGSKFKFCHILSNFGKIRTLMPQKSAKNENFQNSQTKSSLLQWLHHHNRGGDISRHFCYKLPSVYIFSW